MAGESAEPNLLELCLAMDRGAPKLGGSNRFHRRVGRSLGQDDGIYDMLEYAKRAGTLLKRGPGLRMTGSRGNHRRRPAAMSLDALDISGTPGNQRDAEPVPRTSARRRHSSFCDVLGPEACEQCRKMHRQNRFVRNARSRVARSLPDMDELRAEVLPTGSKGKPDIRDPPLDPPAHPTTDRRVVFADDAIAAVRKAQWRHAVDDDSTTGDKSSTTDGQQGAARRRKLPPVIKSKGGPQLSHSQLHKRVIEQHKSRNQPPYQPHY